MQEWGALLGIIATFVGLLWRIVVLFKRFIMHITEDYIEPWIDAIKENTNSLNVAKAEHIQFDKRMGVAENRLDTHDHRLDEQEGRIRSLEGGENKHGNQK